MELVIVVLVAISSWTTIVEPVAAALTKAANGPWSCSMDSALNSYSVICNDSCASGASVCEMSLDNAIESAADQAGILFAKNSTFDIEIYTTGTPYFCNILDSILSTTFIDEDEIWQYSLVSSAETTDNSGTVGNCAHDLSSLQSLRLVGVAGFTELVDIRRAINKDALGNLLALEIQNLVDFSLNLHALSLVLTNIEYLFISSVQLTTSEPDMEGLPSLREFTLQLPDSQDLNITSLGISNMTALSILNLKGSRIQGDLESFFMTLPSLSILSIQDMDISSGNANLSSIINASVQSTYTNITNTLQALQLSNCSLTGEVPVSFTELVQLVELDLSNNALNGFIDEAISSQLLIGNFSNNNFTGTYYVPMPANEFTIDISQNSFSSIDLVNVSTSIGEPNLWWLNTSYETKVDFTQNSMICTCALLSAAWQIMFYGVSGVDASWTCTNPKTSVANSMEIPVIEIAGSPCRDSTSFAIIDTFYFGESNLTLDWTVRASDLSRYDVPSKRSSGSLSTWESFDTCSGCEDLLTTVATSGSPWSTAEYGFMILTERTSRDAECCFVKPMSADTTSYEGTIPVDTYTSEDVVASVTAFAVRTTASGESSVFSDFGVQAAAGTRPSGVSIQSDSDSSLLLEFPKSVSRRLATSNGVPYSLADDAYWELVDAYSGNIIYHKSLPKSGYVDLKYYLLQGSNSAVYTARIATNNSGVEKEYFSSTIGAYLSLRACPAGMGVVQAVNETTGRSQCEICPKDTYSTSELLVCALCSTGTMSPVKGAASSENCSIAQPGYYQVCDQVNASDCTGEVVVETCQSVMNCTEAGTTLANMELMPGYWRANRFTLNIFECNDGYCEPSRNDSRQYCAANHEGFLCSRCKPGYGFTHVGENDICTKCTNTIRWEQWVSLVTVVVIFVCAAASPFVYVTIVYLRFRRSHRDLEHNDETHHPRILQRTTYSLWMQRIRRVWELLYRCGAAKARIALGFVHIYLCMAIFFVVDDMPLIGSMRTLSLLNLSCIVHLAYYGWLVFYSAPGVLWLFCIGVAVWFAKRMLPAQAYQSAKDSLASWFYFVLLLTFPFGLWSSLATFMCSNVEDNYILRISYATYCEGATYRGWEVYSGFILAIFICGGFLSLVIPLHQNRKLLRKPHWTPEEADQARWLEFLHKPYTNRASWFEVYDYSRKCAIIAGVVALRPGPSPIERNGSTAQTNAYEEGFVQIAFGLVCVIISVFLLQIFQPYRNRFDAAFASLTQANLIAISIGAMLWLSSGTNSSARIGYSSTLWGIIAIEICAFLVFTVYDMIHLSQYPDREDEMRVKLRRNFYHRTAPVTTPSAFGGAQSEPDMDTHYSQADPGDNAAWQYQPQHANSMPGFRVQNGQVHTNEMEMSTTGLVAYPPPRPYDKKHFSQPPSPEQVNSFAREESSDGEASSSEEKSEIHVPIRVAGGSRGSRSSAGRSLLNRTPGSRGTRSGKDAESSASSSSFFSHQRQQQHQQQEDHNMLEQQLQTPRLQHTMALDVTGNEDRGPRLRTSRGYLVIDGIYFGTEAYKMSGQVNHNYSDEDWQAALAATEDMPTKDNLVRLGVLGTGVSGTVFIVMDKRNLQLLAVKEIALLNSSLATREVRALDMVCKHSPDTKTSHILHMYNAFLDQDAQRIAVVMDFKSGGSLEDVLTDLKQSPTLVRDRDDVCFKLRTVLSSSIAHRILAGNEPPSSHMDDRHMIEVFGICNESILAQVAQDLLQALATLDELNLLHLDVKPANVLLSRDGRCTLADFGLCQNYDKYSSNDSTKVAGTLRYMSPERLRGAPASHASDIWAFGITLLALVHGRYPIALQDEGELQHALDRGGGGSGSDLYWKLLERVGDAAAALPREARVRAPAGTGYATMGRVQFSQNFHDFIGKVLAPDQEQRPSAKELLKHPWLKLCSTSEPLPPPNTFDWSCQLLERASSVLVQNLDTGTTVYTDEHVRSLSDKLGLSPEIVKYSLAVASGDRSDVTLEFTTAAALRISNQEQDDVARV